MLVQLSNRVQCDYKLVWPGFNFRHGPSSQECSLRLVGPDRSFVSK